MSNARNIGLLRVTNFLLDNLLQLGQGFHVDGAFCDAEDLANDTTTLRIVGAGGYAIVPEGARFPYVDLSEAQRNGMSECGKRMAEKKNDAVMKVVFGEA